MTLALAAALVAGLVSWGVLSALRPALARSLSAAVNERSDHVQPTPQGGGIGILAGLGAGLAVLAGGIPGVGTPGGWIPGGWNPGVGSPGGAPAGLALVAVALGVVGFIDDRRGLPAGVRLVAQAGAVAAGLALLPPAPPLLPWLPPALEGALTAFALLWFVNLFNFMDGMDGLAGSEGVALALGIAVVGFGFGASGSGPGSASLAVALALAVPLGGACLGFLALNRPPARLFLGDVGSLPLGLLFGLALLALARAGYPGPAVLLPLVFVLDATLTLLRRLMKREPVWRAHRQHAYQRARDRGLSASAVLVRVAGANAGLLLLAIAAAARPALAPLAVLLGVALVLLLLARLRGRA